MSQDESCQSVSAVLDYFKEHKEPNKVYWFRGENKDYGESKLLPAIFRSNVSQEEHHLIARIKAIYADKRHIIKDEVEWLALAQHYGCPTRLLDWSGNLLVALYFAVKNSDSHEDGFLYSIDTEVTDSTRMIPNIEGLPSNEMLVGLAKKQPHSLSWDFTELLNKEDKKYKEAIKGSPFEKEVKQIIVEEIINDELQFFLDPKLRACIVKKINSCTMPTDMMLFIMKKNFTGIFFYDPPRLSDLNQRIISQSSKFTIHAGKLDSNGKPLMKCFPAKEYLAIRIKGACKQKILNELKSLGIRHTTLFTEEEHRVKDILE